jgi:hypothetical protein
VFGLVWQRAGAETAFVMGAGIAAVATLLFVLIVPQQTTQQQREPGRS